jgi:ABC-2 type transport system ATP-binding protein
MERAANAGAEPGGGDGPVLLGRDVVAARGAAADGTAAAAGAGPGGGEVADAVVVARQLTKVYRGAPPGPPGRGPAPGGSASAGLVAVDHLDLAVRRGEIFGLLGPNGAGKTTTIGILTTRVLPTSGQAVVGGVDVVAHPARAKRRIGVVSQVNTLDRSLSVRDNLYYHGRYFRLSRREAGRRADELLEQFRLAERASAPVMALSGGMAQRLMVARAILHRPEVLFLDEPTAGLDPQSRLALWDLVRELHGAGQTVVLTTHYMEEADQLCERLAVMDHGRVLALDTPEGLKQSLGGASEIRVDVADGAGRLAEALRRGLGSEVDGVVAGDGGVRLAARRAGGLLASVVAIAEEAGVAVVNVAVSEPTLESVFINLTGRDLRE